MCNMKNSARRILSLVLCICMVLSLVPVLTPAVAADAYNGVSADPRIITSTNYYTFGLTDDTYVGYYAIRNAAELYGFAKIVNGGRLTANGVLLQDIVVNETVSAAGAQHVWTPIGTDLNNPYLGTFDGNGHTISGIYVNGNGENMGIFGVVGEISENGGQVKNLTLADSYIRGGQSVGGIVGTLSGDVASIRNCTVAADVTVIATGGEACVGGICGDFGNNLVTNAGKCILTNCVMLGKVSAPNSDAYVGAIVGLSGTGSVTGDLIVVSNCYYITGNTTNKDGVYNFGNGSLTGSNEGCTQLSSATADHSCLSVTHKEVYNTCDGIHAQGYSGRSEYSYCQICGKVTSGTKVDTPAGHTLTVANCKSASYCRTCNLTQGSKDPNNHINTLWQVNPTDRSTHIYTHACCGIVLKTENHKMDSNAYCATCDYTCEHIKIQNNACVSCGAVGIASYINRYYASGTLYEIPALVASATYVTAETTTLADGWYIVEGNVTVNARLKVNNRVNLLLMDGATLNATKGIVTRETTVLTIYGQSADTGALIATGESYNAGLGSQGGYGCGFITICGGTIRATGGKQAPGIGRGRSADDTKVETITILGGNVYAASGGGSAGIGAGKSVSAKSVTPNITIRGGYVEARGDGESTFYQPGIGATNGTVSSTITISGGTIRAIGSPAGAAGIGNGAGVNGGSIMILGGNVCSQDVNGTTRLGASAISNSVLSVINDGLGREIAMMELTLGDASQDVQVTEVAGLEYKLHDVKTLDGKLYFYPLKDAAAPTSITAGGVVYDCTADQKIFYANHDFQDGACSRCGEACRHDYKNSVCTICGDACPHEYARTTYVEPKCYAQGFAAYRCNLCDHEYNEILDSLDHEWVFQDCEKPMICKLCQRSGEIPGHDYKQTVVPPTCTEDGYTRNYCEGCGDSYNTDPVTSSGHGGGTPTCTEPAKCSTCGESYGEPLNHNPEADDGDCTTPIRCSRCKEITTDGYETHNFVDNLRCDRCGTNNRFTYTFMVDGQVYATETVEATTFFTFPNPGEHNGLFFQGWDADNDGVADYAGANTDSYIYVNGSLTFTAVYGQMCQIRYYTVNIDTGEYQYYGANTVMTGEATNLDGYYSYYHKFLGWATEPNGQPVYQAYQSVIPTADLTLYAAVRPFRATIDLNGNNAEWMDDNGQPIKVLEASLTNPSVDILNSLPIRPGRQFLGFMDDTGYLYEPWVDEETGDVWLSIYFMEDTHLVAQWTDCTAHTGGTPTCNGQKCAYCDEYYGEKDPAVHAEDVTCVNGICPNGCVIPVAKIGETTYTDLSEALKAGGHVVLLSDIDIAAHLTVRIGTTLDLNGHRLDTTGYLTVYGDIVDGDKGGEALITAKNLHIQGKDSFLPIYDTAAGGYRFYAYELENLGGKAAGENAAKFGIRLELVNVSGYTILANSTDSRITLSAIVTWGEEKLPLTHTFRASTLVNYAQQVNEKLAAGETVTTAIVLTVSGLDVLEEGEDLFMQPTITSNTTVSATASKEAYIR